MKFSILFCHVCTGNDGNEADFQKAMCSGRWLLDPAAADRPDGDLGGYHAEVLNADLARLSVLVQAGDRPRLGDVAVQLN